MHLVIVYSLWMRLKCHTATKAYLILSIKWPYKIRLASSEFNAYYSCIKINLQLKIEITKKTKYSLVHVCFKISVSIGGCETKNIHEMCNENEFYLNLSPGKLSINRFYSTFSMRH